MAGQEAVMDDLANYICKVTSILTGEIEAPIEGGVVQTPEERVSDF
jgi:hypothetical protein